MPRWLRLVRGMIGTGLAFAVAGPAIVLLIGAGFMLFGNASLGGGVRLLAWTAMGLNGAFKAWTVDTALVNLILLTSIGAGAAATTLFVARKSKAALKSREEQLGLGEGAAPPVDMSRDAERVKHRE